MQASKQHAADMQRCTRTARRRSFLPAAWHSRHLVPPCRMQQQRAAAASGCWCRRLESAQLGGSRHLSAAVADTGRAPLPSFKCRCALPCPDRSSTPPSQGGLPPSEGQQEGRRNQVACACTFQVALLSASPSAGGLEGEQQQGLRCSTAAAAWNATADAATRPLTP